MCKIKSSLYAGNPTGTITVDVEEMSINLLVDEGESFSIMSIYGTLKPLWTHNETLKKYDFPVLCKTKVDLLIRKPWKLLIEVK